MSESPNNNGRGVQTSSAVSASTNEGNTPAMTSVRNWDDLVSEGRQLKIMEERIDAEHGNIRWQWGDLALEVAPMGQDSSHTGGYERLERYADEIDVSFSALREYRRVAEVWSPAMRVAGEPWVVHAMLAAKKYEDRREEIISHPVDVLTGEAVEHWTQRRLQRFLGNKVSPVHRKQPETTAEKLAEVNELFALVGDDEAVEFIDRVVDFLSALDERTERPEPAPPAPLTERWEKWLNQTNTLFITAAKLMRETEDAGEQLGGLAAFAMYLAERFSERKFDAELRDLLENEGAG